jgi:hypothetical protein
MSPNLTRSLRLSRILTRSGTDKVKDSHWGFEEIWSGTLCLEKRNINLKVFVYDRSGRWHMTLATMLGFCVCETRRN